MNLKKGALTGLLAFVFLSPLHANPFKVSDELDLTIQKGLHELYNLNFEEAEKIFISVSTQAADHPMVAFGKASVHWWWLSVNVLDTDEKESEAFLKAADECIKLSLQKIDRGDPTGEGYLTLGGAYGLLGRWQATNQKWMSAYFTGKKAVKYLRKSLKTNPEMEDANMGLGIFDYYVATLPSVVRTLAFLGSNSDPQVGLAELESAANKGTYARTPSKLFLVEMYANPENKPERAFGYLAELRREYPQSSFIHTMEIISLYNFEKFDELKRETEAFQANVENKTYHHDAWPNAYFVRGLVPFKNRQWEDAIGFFDKAISTGTIKSPFLTWSTLYKGYALDALGKREEAKSLYKEVLGQLRRWGSYEAAKKRLSKPFKGTDEDLDKLVL